MLALLGFLMVAVFMYLIMSNRVSPLVALMIVPVAFALVGGFAADLGPMMTDGIKNIASTGVMLLFAILYFGVMIDAGTFDPIVSRILKFVKGDPLKIVVGTAILTTLISLDGDGTTTYMITVAAMFPLYKRLGMNPLILTAVAMLSSGIMNLTPWGGPTARAMTALHLDASELFVPLIPSMLFGLGFLLLTAYFLGKKERKRLGIVEIQYSEAEQRALNEQAAAAAAADEPNLKRPKLLWFNALLTILLLASLVMSVLPLTVLFMLGFAIAVSVNYPKLKDQQERITAHAKNALAVVSMVFAAGIFTGILSGTKMVDAMANTLVTLIPDAWGPHLPVITAITSMPFTFFMSNDAYYFGVLPIIAEAASAYGIDAVEIGRASLLGQPVHLLSPLVPSTYLLVGMVGVSLGDHQRYALKWLVGGTFAMLIGALITGVISF